jgi:hypothetical protein
VGDEVFAFDAAEIVFDVADDQRKLLNFDVSVTPTFV